MQKFLRSRLISLKHAIIGLQHVIKTQKNAWIHFFATVLVVSICILLPLSKNEWVSILLVVGMVWMAEFLNTALEVIVDLASPDQHPLAKIGKDVGAAAVLIAAGIALIIGLIIFIPHLWELLTK